MDRNKPSGSSRSQKKITTHIGGELFALGTKSQREDSKSKILPVKAGTSLTDRKRESASNISSASKRFKSNKDNYDSAGLGSLQFDVWEQLAKDCDALDLIGTIHTLMNQNDDSVIQLICGLLKTAITSNVKSKIDPILILVLTYVSKLYPHIFCHEIITEALLSILRRDVNTKPRYASHMYAIAANILTKSYNEKAQWPELFLRLYIEDAVNERLWVDDVDCAPFVNNITAAFETVLPPSNLLSFDSNNLIPTGQPTRDVGIGFDEELAENVTQPGDNKMPLNVEISEVTTSNYTYEKRFSDSTVQKFVIEAVRDQMNKRQQQDNYTKNFLKFLCSTSGIADVRSLSIARLELWIHNGKLVKFAQQLLAYICFNIKGKCSKDNETLGVLVKIRLKTKPLINHYINCLKEVIKLQPDILNIILKLVVQNELSNTRNPNNVGMLATMFQTLPDQSATNLAGIYQEFLLQREDCLRTLRVFLRELVRLFRFDVNIMKFCKVLLTPRLDITSQIEHSEFRERIFYSMVDIVCLCMFLSVTPSAREACVLLRTSRELKNSQVLIKFYNQVSQIQLDAVSWMYESVPNLFKVPNSDYNQALHKLLLLENPEQYSRSDQWPSEPERGTLLRMISETPIHEETILRIILIGITKDIPFTISETFDIILQVIKRVSAMKIANCPAVQANKFDIIDFLFSMSEYHHPENIILPTNYEPPKLAIIVYYWKAWLILLMISAHNPSTFGAFCWDHYPTMKMLMEMCITNQFNNNAISKDELQLLSLEKEHILQYETYLAAQTSPQAIITEENALLVSQLMVMDPMGAARKLPTVFLDQLKFLNQTYRLGHLFCRCRKPDLLLDIIQRHGTTQSMPWLSDLVQNSEGDLNHLPVQCLCEFLLFNAHNINEENSRDAELLSFLRNLILNQTSNKQTVCEILDYIFRRLSSTVKQSRMSALAGIKIIFQNTEQNENHWLLKSIPQLPHFADVKSFIIPQLRAACQVENTPELIMTYIQFIAAHTLNDPVNEMLDHVIDMAQLIVERNTMFQYIVMSPDCTSSTQNQVQTLKCLFVMFNNYIIKLREFNEPYEWTEYPDLLMVQFEDGVQLPLHINIIHAFIILLTFSSNNMPESIPILDYWFPPGRAAPIAFLPNLPDEPVQLLPDWLKLKMIRSPVERLIEAALHGLTPDQIVLFVQNFGTPVNSMSKLLAMLDTAVLEQFDAVKNAILNKAYLAQLIEIQQARGAKNGHYTVQALELYSHSQTVPDLPKLNVQILDKVYISDYETVRESRINTFNNLDEVEEALQHILKAHKLDKFLYYCHRRLIYKILENFQCGSSSNISLQNLSMRIVQIFLNALENFKGQQFYQSIVANRHTCTLFRAIANVCLTADCYSAIEKITSENLSGEQFGNTQLALHFKSLISFLSNSKKEHNVKKFKQQYVAFQKKEIIKQVLKSFDEPYGNNLPRSNLLCHNGLFVDWLSVQDPEIVRSGILNVKYLFGIRYNEFRFYLLSLINHQTNWDTITYIADYLFEEKNPHLDYSTILNYFEALINNPKLWKGLDKCMSKTNQPSKVFVLQKEKELESFTGFILNEGAAEHELNNYDYKLCSRMNLLFKVTEKDGSTMVKFVDYVSKSPCSEKLKLQVLQQLYIMYPSIKFLKLNKADEQVYKLQTLKGCQADKVSNYLITCLGSLTTKKDFEALSGDTELLLRKLAASHPTLFLRQLSVLSSLIEGKAQNNIQALREEYLVHRFMQILRIVELLQPIIFEDTYKNEFQTTLANYFVFFKHHSSVKEAYQLLIKFAQLLQTYIKINPSSALLFIEHYVGILIELAAKYTSIAILQQLVQAIALLQHKSVAVNELYDDETKQEFDLENPVGTKVNKVVPFSEAELTEVNPNLAQLELSNHGGALSLVISNSYYKSPTSTSQPFLNLIKIIKESNAEDVILGPLQEIECLTSKRFTFLNDLFDRLLELIFSPSAQVRSIAYIILIRHLKHKPGQTGINKSTLNAYLQCLRDENSSVASTAVDNLCEMTLLMQEYATEILCVAFSLGIKTRLNTSTQIKKVLQTIMLQNGY